MCERIHAGAIAAAGRRIHHAGDVARRAHVGPETGVTVSDVGPAIVSESEPEPVLNALSGIPLPLLSRTVNVTPVSARPSVRYFRQSKVQSGNHVD